MNADQLCALAHQHHLAGDLTRAETLYRAALEQNPRHAEALHRLGRLANAKGHGEAAIGLIEQAVRLKPRSAEYRDGLGLALRSAGRNEEAAAAFRHAIRLDKSSFAAHYNLGNSLMALRQFSEAVQCFRRAIVINPNYAGAHNNLGNSLRRVDDPARAAEAGPYLRRAVDLAPHEHRYLCNYGVWLQEAGDLAGSEATLRAGLALAPGDPELHHSLGLTLLCMGRMREGLAEYEWRFQARKLPQRHGGPAWTGAPGATLLIAAEQGQGDMIQFLRYVPLAAERMRVVLEVSPHLRRLAQSVPGVAALFCPGEPVPEHDAVCSLLSLPHILQLDDAPLGMDAADPYLRPDPDDVARWARLLAPIPGRKIGLVWAGARDFDWDRHRSVPPALFNALAGDGLSFISLQKDPTDKPGLPLADWTGALKDYADTAALVANLDLVISVDTSVAHLAGAIGKPVWLLNRFDGDWRWLRAGEGSAWYPTLRQFRQPRLGDWASVMQAVRAALQSP